MIVRISIVRYVRSHAIHSDLIDLICVAFSNKLLVFLHYIWGSNDIIARIALQISYYDL